MLEIQSKPTKNGVCKLELSCNSKKQTVFAHWVWSSPLTNDFDGEKICISFSLEDLATILCTLEKGGQWSFRRTHDLQTIEGALYYIEKNDKRGYCFSIKTEEGNWTIGLNFSKARLVKEFILWSFDRCFTSSHNEKKKEIAEREKQQEEIPPTSEGELEPEIPF